MISSKAELLALSPLKKGVVEYAGQQIEVHELSAAQVDQMNGLIKEVSDAEKGEWQKVQALIVVMGCAFLTEQDLPDLMDSSPELIKALQAKINELSGLDEEDDAEEKKPSENDQT